MNDNEKVDKIMHYSHKHTPPVTESYIKESVRDRTALNEISYRLEVLATSIANLTQVIEKQLTEINESIKSQKI